METRQEISLKAFTLHYDGIYQVTFSYNEKKYTENVCLHPSDVLKIIKNEKLSVRQLKDIEHKGIPCKSSTLILEIFTSNGKFDGFLTSEYSENYFENNIIFLECSIV